MILTVVGKRYNFGVVASNGENVEIATNEATESKIASQTSVTVQHIAGYCLVSRSTVRRWIKDGKLSAMKLPSGHYRVTVADFRAFLERYNMPIKEELFESKSERKEEA